MEGIKNKLIVSYLITILCMIIYAPHKFGNYVSYRIISMNVTYLDFKMLIIEMMLATILFSGIYYSIKIFRNYQEL